MSLDLLYWREPGWLLLLLLPLLHGWWERRASRAALGRFAEPALWPWVQANESAAGRGVFWRRAAWGLAWALLVVALSGPRTPLVVPAQAQPEQGELWLLMDLSASMSALEPAGSRRQQAIALAGQWLQQDGLPAVGVRAFAGRSHVLAAPSQDPQAVWQMLQALSDVTLPSAGNDLAGALDGQQPAGVKGRRALAVLTDGDIEPEALAAAVSRLAALHEAGWSIRIVGVGALVDTPIPDPDSGWLRAAGRLVLSRRNDSHLDALAKASGQPVRLVEQAQDLATVWPFPVSRIARSDVAGVQWREWFPWPLMAGAGFLLLALLRPGAGTAAVLVLGLGAQPGPAQAATAQQALAAQDWPLARERYAAIQGYRGRMGEGVACYRLEELNCASRAFAAAAWQAGSDRERSRAAYNLANTVFRQGDYANAATLYRDAMASDTSLREAERNLSITETIIERIQVRLAQTEASKQRRPGRGLGQRDPPPGWESSQAVQLSVSQDPTPPVPPPDDVSDAQIERWVSAGLLRARAAASGDTVAQQSRPWRADTERGSAQPAAALWQRLFELEEGFGAPQRRPRLREGQRPW